MMKYFISLIVISLFLISCGSVPQNRYYLLDYIPTPSVEKSTNYNLRIKDLRIAQAYRRPEIIYRQSAHEMLFYNYHQWAVKPEHLVTNMVIKHLRSAKLFKAISKTLVDFKPDYNLTGEILAIEEYDNNEKWYAHLAIDFQLEDARTGKQVWHKTYDVRKEVVQHEPVYVVRELSYLLENITDRMISELQKKLRAGTPIAKKSLTPPEPVQKELPKTDSISAKPDSLEKK